MKRFLFLLILIPVFGFSQDFELKSYAETNYIGSDEYLKFTIESNEKVQFNNLTFNNFIIKGGPFNSTSSSTSFINGKIDRSETYTTTYLLAPKKEGELVIESIKTRVKERDYTTNPITIIVYKPGIEINRSFGFRNIQLRDSESVQFPFFSKNFNNGQNLIDNTYFKFSSPAFLRTFSTELNNTQDFITYINFIHNTRGLGYWNTLTNNKQSKNTISDCLYAFPINDVTFDWNKINGFKTYYKTIFNSKTARKILFDAAIDIVSYWCEKLPIDFYLDIKNEINKLLKFTDKLKVKSLSEINKLGHYDLRSYWEGFIVRRITENGVQIDEIQELLNSGMSELKKIDQSKLSDVYFKLRVNNDIEVLFKRSRLYLLGVTNNKKIRLKIMPKNLKEIKYFSDETSEYYVFITYDFYGREVYRCTYDNNLNLIE